MDAGRSDAELSKQVERALHGNLKLDVSRLEVAVEQGAVHLRGSVRNSAQKREAVDTVRSLGVSNVVDETSIEPAQRIPDHEVVREVQAALVRDHRVKEKDVSVEAHDGIVVLTGLVDSPAQRAFAEEDVWSVPGVVGVDDRMATLPEPTRADPEVAADVSETLRANPWIDDSRVVVAVHDQAVTLRGTVANREQKRLAEDATRWVRGVRKVHDELEVAA